MANNPTSTTLSIDEIRAALLDEMATGRPVGGAIARVPAPVPTMRLLHRREPRFHRVDLHEHRFAELSDVARHVGRRQHFFDSPAPVARVPHTPRARHRHIVSVRLAVQESHHSLNVRKLSFHVVSCQHID
nr:hypothetical protein [Burkholderia metallica]